MARELGTIAERYTLEEQVAQGGMATVWKARDQVLARTVAVKMLHPHLSHDKEFLERFRREAMAAARLSHPSIVAIYDTGDDSEGDGDGRHYIVMEYCGGGTLADMLVEGPVAPGRVAGAGTAICAALGYAHRHGIVHRDVKPANVLIAPDGTLKVTDFGIAKAAFIGDMTTTGSLLGTVTYISPEQARGEEPDARSDLYSLGVLLYELLVGRPPFAADSAIATAMQHVNADPPPPRSIRAGIPRRLEAVVLQALAKDPAERFQSADDMRAALASNGAEGGDTVILAARPDSAAPRPPSGAGVPARRARRTRLIPALVLMLVVAALGLIAAALLGGEDDPGSPRGPQTAEEPPAGTALDIELVTDFDPHGDGTEHADETSLVDDGDPATEWTTENYESSLSAQKPGVGLLLDLGTEAEVASLRLVTSTPGYSLEIRAASELPEDESTADVVTDSSAVADVEVLEFDPVSARYWIVWITELPGSGAGSASIAEVELSAP